MPRATDVLPDFDQVIKAYYLDLKPTDLNRLGTGQDRFRITERFEITDKMQIAQRSVESEVAAQCQRVLVDLK